MKVRSCLLHFSVLFLQLFTSVDANLKQCKNIISKEILRILRNFKGKREPESPQGNGAKCFPGAAAPESKRLPVGPLQKKLPGASSHFFELCGGDFGNFIFLRNSKDPQKMDMHKIPVKTPNHRPGHQPQAQSTLYGSSLGDGADERGPPTCDRWGRGIRKTRISKDFLRILRESLENRVLQNLGFGQK